MLSSIYSIRDTQLGTFGLPFVSHNDISAQRAISIAVKDNTLQLSHFPEHFHLFKLGEFDDSNGQILLSKQPTFIITVLSLTQRKPENVKE